MSGLYPDTGYINSIDSVAESGYSTSMVTTDQRHRPGE